MSVQIVTGSYRASFAHLAAPNKFDKYSVSLLVPKEDTAFIEELKKAKDVAVVEGTASLWAGKPPKDDGFPVLDGDDSEYEEEHGHWVVRCSAKNCPPVYDADGNPLPPAEVYSGCYIRVQINVYPYFWNNTKKGVSIGLNAVLKTGDGERFGGGNTSPEVFGITPQENDGGTASPSNPFGA